MLINKYRYSQMMRLFLLFITTAVFSQKQFPNIDNFTLSPHRNEIQVWTTDSIFTYDVNLKLKNSKKIPEEFDGTNIQSLRMVMDDKHYFLTPNGSGEVFDSIHTKISSPYVLNFFNNSSRFIHKGTLYKFGGYAYWTSFKQLIYFDVENRDWNYYNLKIPKEFNGLFGSDVVQVNENEFFVYGGFILNPSDHLKQIRNKKIYAINFSTSEFLNLGSTELEISGKKINLTDGKTLIFKRGHYEVLDWNKNTIKKYNAKWTFRINSNYPVLMIEDLLFFVQNNENNFSISKHKLDFKSSDLFYSDVILETNDYSLVYIFCFVLFVLFFYFIFKDFNTILISKNSIKYRFLSFEIDEETQQILLILCENKKVSSNELFEIMSSKDLHPNHIYRLIPEKMNDLSNLLRLITSNKGDVFYTSKNKKDRRINDYFLNRLYTKKEIANSLVLLATSIKKCFLSFFI